jgi:hypothetical protein
MRLKNLDLIVTVTFATLNVVWATLPGHILAMGIILALPLVFVLPGYTLTETLFNNQSLGGPARLLFSLGLSLAIDILCGLVLSLLPVGLRGTSWTMLLGTFTVLFSLLVAYLRGRTPSSGVRLPRLRFTTSNLVLFGLATLVVVLSIAYDAVGVAQQPYPGFTQLWVLPAAQAEKGCAVRLGVRSFESTPITYRIMMTIEKAQAATWPSVVLAPQGEWGLLVSIPPEATDNVYVEVQLYRIDKPQKVYREVNVTLHSCPTLQVTPNAYPVLASLYNGTIYDILANIETNISLTGIQQSEGNISGYLTLGTGLQGSGSFKGMVTTGKHIQFTVTDSTAHATLSFEGGIDSSGTVADGTIAGSYCGLNQQGQCSGAYGLWSVAPASP